MIKRTIVSAVALAALASQPGVAQQHEHSQGQPAASETGSMMEMMSGGMMEMMSGGMMGMMSSGMMEMSMMPFRPGALLRSVESLGLSDDQQARLQALAESGKEEHGQHAQAAMAAHQQAESSLESDAPDMDAYAEALQSAARHMAMAHVAMTRTALEARTLLSTDQREKVSDAMSMMRGMMQGDVIEARHDGGRDDEAPR